MRKLLAVMFAAVLVFTVLVAVVQSSSSSQAAKTETASVLEVEATAPGVAETEQFACASCSRVGLCIHYIYVVEAEIVKEPSITLKNARGARSFTTTDSRSYGNIKYAVALAPTAGTALKLPSVAAVSDEPDAHEAACSRVEVLNVGVEF